MTVEQQIKNLLSRSRDIQTLARTNDSYVRFGDYSEDVDRWINDVDIFYQRYLQEHPLKDRFHSIIFHRKKDCFRSLIGCLESVGADSEFLKKREVINMKDYEKFLKTCVESVDKDDPNYRIVQYEMKGEDRMIIKKLEGMGLISNVIYMGIKYVGFDITYDGLHYFDEETKTEKIYKADFKLRKYDLFLSHASKDKISYVEGLKQTLDKLGLSIFYDKDSIEWGDRWKEKILEGVAKSEFAIIVVSENFFGREWTEKELSEFLNRQNDTGQKIILPILYDITYAQLEEKYPTLADIQAISSQQYTNEEIAILFAEQYIKRLKGKLNE